jgi:hypothetical protein
MAEVFVASLVRRISILLCVCVSALHFSIFSSQGQTAREQYSAATAQDKAPRSCIECEQMPLTEKHILGLLASADEIDEIRENSDDCFYQTGPETTAKLNAVAKKDSLAGYEEYKTIRANVLLVFSGYDWVKSQYVGREQLIRIRVARAKADRSMSAKDKKLEIESLNAQRVCTLPEVQYMGNIELVRKYYARLNVSEF